MTKKERIADIERRLAKAEARIAELDLKARDMLADKRPAEPPYAPLPQEPVDSWKARPWGVPQPSNPIGPIRLPDAPNTPWPPLPQGPLYPFFF